MAAEARQAPAPVDGLVEAILVERPLKAGAFIVTLYGDVVVPRGGTVWIGNIIETCAAVGINESLVRTAVSRLVAAGRLEGARAGRRSFYRLTAGALAEFEAAAAVLFGSPAAAASDWQFVHLPAGEGREPPGFARLGPRLAAAAWGRPPPAGALVFRAAADPAADPEALRAFAAQHWQLAAHAEAYADFLRRFGPLFEQASDDPLPPGGACLTARLLLVNEFRKVALADPRLPEAALPAGWPGAAARRLFARLYLRLSGPADALVAERFLDGRGPLRARGDTLARRRTALEATPTPPAETSRTG